MQIKRILLLIILIPAFLIGQDKEESKVLFIGNSFTFFWNMPQMVEAMAIDQGQSLSTYQSTVSGSNLKQHWLKEKNTVTRDILEGSEWDYVILQDHSMSTIDSPERFNSYGGQFIDLIKNKGSEPLLFTTWAYNSNPLMQDAISAAYQQLGKNKDVKVIPVGDIFMKAKSLRPDLNLYFDDKHPSSDGSYLIALIFYKFLTGKSVDSIPNRLVSKDIKGEQVILSFVLPANGDFLRNLVENSNMQTLKPQ